MSGTVCAAIGSLNIQCTPFGYLKNAISQARVTPEIKMASNIANPV
jgi:hypothetical protein